MKESQSWRRVEERIAAVQFEYREKETFHNSYQREQREVECIRQGDVEGLERLERENAAGQTGRLAVQPLRAEKNLAVCALTLFCRAGIQGGLLPEVAFSISDAVIQTVEEQTSAGEIGLLVRTAKFRYAALVAENRAEQSRNLLVEGCKNYICQNMHRKIEVQEIARSLHVAPGYLSQVFHRVTGMTVMQYMMKEKTDHCANLLKYSEYSYEAIAYYFGFCSQSHFGKVFRRWKGMTPRQYRETYKVREQDA